MHSNYEIDTVRGLIGSAKSGGCRWCKDACDASSPALKVIADHIRACSFTVADGVIPSNEGRGYVLRHHPPCHRHGYKLVPRTPFFHKLVAIWPPRWARPTLSCAPERKRITDVLKTEEERFFQTIANGMGNPEGALAGQTGDGETAFKLHDTYGFPLT